MIAKITVLREARSACDDQVFRETCRDVLRIDSIKITRDGDPPGTTGSTRLSQTSVRPPTNRMAITARTPMATANPWEDDYVANERRGLPSVKTISAVLDNRRARTAGGAYLELSAMANGARCSTANWSDGRECVEIQQRLDEIDKKSALARGDPQ